jgi:hypothetical protein
MPSQNQPEEKLTNGHLRALMESASYLQALDLYTYDILLKSEAGKTLRSQIAELLVFDPISDGFMRQFGKMERNKGELFVPTRRGYPQPNVVVDPNPERPSVLQLTKVRVDGEEKSLGSLMKTQFPGQDFDCYDLPGAGSDSPISLVPATVAPNLEFFSDVRGKAMAIIRRS